MKVDLPAGASLREVPGPQGLGAIELVRGDAVLARIAAPGTRDADGQPVPTTMSVQGDSVVISVDHHGQDLAYPLTTDPTVTVSDPGVVCERCQRL